MQEAGVPDFDISTWYGLFVPASTPDDVVAHLNKAITGALRSAPVQERLEKLGGVASPTTPEEFQELVTSESEKYARLGQAFRRTRRLTQGAARMEGLESQGIEAFFLIR